MIRWTGHAAWEFEFPFPGSLTSTFLGRACMYYLVNPLRGAGCGELGLSIARGRAGAFHCGAGFGVRAEDVSFKVESFGM